MTSATTNFARDTAAAIVDKSDEVAVAKYGCRFNLQRGMEVVEWIQRYCRLYEGKWYGQPMVLKDWQLDATLRLYGWEIYSEDLGKWIRRFRNAVVFVAKKNKKTPTAAAWALYSLCGDGEHGNHVYLAAKDGKMVKRGLGKHIRHMVDASPELKANIKFNSTLFRFDYGVTRSDLEPLASGSKRTNETTEGLNSAGIFVDEVHVVDSEFVSHISRAGSSRDEPLFVEVSTAGNNVASYGHQRFREAIQIRDGVKDDIRTLAIVYAAPQDLSDEELDRDPLKYLEMANPALGHTVTKDVLLQDYQSSKGDASKLAEFKMYRLNIWVNSARPWIKSDRWAACHREYTLETLRGRKCFGGVDLSYASDSSALVLIFPNDDGTYHLWAQIFVPQSEVMRVTNVPYTDWDAAGYCEIIPGQTMKDTILAGKMIQLLEQFELELQTVCLDPTYAANVADALENHGASPLSFGQSYKNFASPTARFEQMTLDGEIYHPGNPCFTWQVMNTVVLIQSNGYMKPVKPTTNTHSPLKVDACQAAVMALAAAISDGPEDDPMEGINSFYDLPPDDRRRLYGL